MVANGLGVFVGLLMVLGAIRIFLVGEVFITGRSRGLPVQSKQELDTKWSVSFVRGRLKVLPWVVVFFGAGAWLLDFVLRDLFVWLSKTHTPTDRTAVAAAMILASIAVIWLQGSISLWLRRSTSNGDE